MAAQQFRDVRNMERENLTKLEETKLIRRGNDYIEGIARVFEARNYLVIFTAFITSLAVHWWGWPYAFAVGPICIFLSIKMMSGNQLGDIVEVVPAKVHFEGSLLMVEDVVIMNVGLPETREKILQEGMGVLIKPKNDDARLTLHAPGQRQAIIHDVFNSGLKVDAAEQI